MRKTVSLNQNHEFRRLYHKKSAVGASLVTYICKNRFVHNRVGITTSKSIGKAHSRNRARRVIREAYRQIAPLLNDECGFDIVFVARTRTTSCKMQEVCRLMKKQLSPYFKKNDEANI